MIQKGIIIALFCILQWSDVVGFTTNTALQKIVIKDTDSPINSVDLDQKIIEEFKNNPDYNYIEEEIEQNSLWSKFQRWLSRVWRDFWRWIFGDSYSENSFLVFLYKSLPYLIIATAVGFIIWVFYKLNPGVVFLKEKEMGEVFYTEEEEIIKTQNIKELIKKALDENNYRLAVRYYYLYIIQQLSQTGLIHYEFDKTNTDYLNELDQASIKDDFKQVTHLYDYTWYGNFDVSETDYSRAQQLFIALENKISAKT